MSLDEHRKLRAKFHITEIGGCITKIQHRMARSPRLPPFAVTQAGNDVHDLARKCSTENVLRVLEEYDAKNFKDGEPRIKWLGCKQIMNDDTTMEFHSEELGITFTGTPDRVFHLYEGDIYVIVDWKSGSRYMSKHKQQLQRYAALLAKFLGRNIQTYLVVAYHPEFEINQDCDPTLVSLKEIRAWEHFTKVPRDVYELASDDAWVRKVIETIAWDNVHEPSIQFECAFCPYNAVCRGYPFGVPPIDEPDRFDHNADEVKQCDNKKESDCK